MRAWHLEVLRAEHATIADALSGKRLDIFEQCAPRNPHLPRKPPLHRAQAHLLAGNGPRREEARHRVDQRSVAVKEVALDVVLGDEFGTDGELAARERLRRHPAQARAVRCGASERDRRREEQRRRVGALCGSVWSRRGVKCESEKGACV